MASTYQRTYGVLTVMLEKGLVKRGRDHTDEPYLYWLADTNLKWMTGDINRRHEMECSRLCVAYAPHWGHWDNGWSAYEREHLRVEKWEVEYDRRMLLKTALLPDGSKPWPLIWEVDGSSEPIYPESRRERVSDKVWKKSINGKVDKYLRLAKDNPEAWFTVLFATYDGHLGKASKRANQIVTYLADRGLTRGQFLVTTVDRAVAGPLGKVFLRPASRDLHSLLDL